MLTTERRFWHCGASYTAGQKVVIWMDLIPPIIPYYQSLLFSAARGGRGLTRRARALDDVCVERSAVLRQRQGPGPDGEAGPEPHAPGERRLQLLLPRSVSRSLRPANTRELPLSAAHTLNATGQPRVTLSPRYEHLRAVCGLRQEERGLKLRPKSMYSRRPILLRSRECEHRLHPSRGGEPRHARGDGHHRDAAGGQHFVDEPTVWRVCGYA